jgi:hypothetical protein
MVVSAPHPSTIDQQVLSRRSRAHAVELFMTPLCIMLTDDERWEAAMRLFSQFVLRSAQTLALLMLALTLASPVSSQTTALDDTIQAIAQRQQVISQTYKLESAGEGIVHLEALALLAAYGGWTRYEGEAATGGIKPNENSNIVKFIGRIKPDLATAKKAIERNKSAAEEELKRFSDILANVEKLSITAIEVHDLLEEGKVNEANATYRDKSIPLIQSINADSYTLISGLEQKIAKAALQARLAK